MSVLVVNLTTEIGNIIMNDKIVHFKLLSGGEVSVLQSHIAAISKNNTGRVWLYLKHEIEGWALDEEYKTALSIWAGETL